MASEQNDKRAEFDDLLRENRSFPPPQSFRDQARVRDEQIYADAGADPESFWAEFAGELEWSRPWDTVLDWQPPHAKWFVGGQLNVAVNCLDRHVRGAAPQQGRHHLGGRAGRSPHADLLRALSRSLRVRQRAQVLRHQEGRPRRHLHAARAGTGRRDARVRPHRRRPQHRVRRVQRRSASRSHQRRRGPPPDHRGWRIPPRPDRAVETGGGRGGGRCALNRERRRRAARLRSGGSTPRARCPRP